MRILTFIFILHLAGAVAGQTHFTHYDELPCIQQNIKPRYQETMPEWAGMMYRYPVNYRELIEARKQAEMVKSPIERYFRIWQRCVQDYVAPDGSIVLPDVEAMQKEMYALQSNAQRLKKRNDSQWSFVGPKETFWLIEAGSSTPRESGSFANRTNSTFGFYRHTSQR
jgi:hypothetical protein